MKKVTLLFVVLLLCFNIAQAETVWGDINTRHMLKHTIDYQGTIYYLRDRVTPILLMGIDKRESEQSQNGEYRNGGQADFLVLLVIDDANRTIQPIQINRDTMMEITVLNLMGNVSGTRTAQICLAHGFGDGAEQSCEFVVSALSDYLFGTPIEHYLSMSMNGIAAFNEMLDGIEVTLDADFTMYDPEMVKGATIVLNGQQAEVFVRQRYYIGDGSNEYRLARQRIYLEAAKDKIVEHAKNSSGFVLELFDAVEEWCVTDISRGLMANLANKVNTYEILPMMEVDGESVLGQSGHMEFSADEENLMQVLLTAMYAPVE